ncbi:MAG: hypothetical protein AUJ98_00030 [Bacteroidetes bacterium CG2_30_33_31]|nr:MAG: hypothetical protein AUJ98_00030 [Bacteroidetes bacterium CG2_30_33_31]
MAFFFVHSWLFFFAFVVKKICTFTANCNFSCGKPKITMKRYGITFGSHFSDFFIEQQCIKI